MCFWYLGTCHSVIFSALVKKKYQEGSCVTLDVRQRSKERVLALSSLGHCLSLESLGPCLPTDVSLYGDFVEIL